MSAEDETDVELKDLLIQTLESNGSLAKIRAQLRACVFLALDEDEMLQKKKPFLNNQIKTQIETSNGRLMFCIVREFLEFFNLDNTILVYDPETYLGAKYIYEGRDKIIQDLQIECNSSVPLLLQLIEIAQRSKHAQDDNLINGTDLGVSIVNYKSDDESETSIYENLKPSNHESHNKRGQNVLNETFNVSNSTINTNKPYINGISDKMVSETSDYINNSEHIKENGKTTLVVDLNSALNININDLPKSESIIDITLTEGDFSPPILRDTKVLSPQKSEKFKGKSSLTSLADLPSLPSLYRDKEMKEKLNLKELDKICVDFDAYEEDFTSNSEDSINKSNDNSRIDDKSVCTNDVLSNKVYTDSVNQTDQILSKSLNVLVNRERNDSVTSSITSDDFDLNSHDDILKSED